MPLTVEDIDAISRAVAAEQGPAVEVIGVVSNLGGEGRVELLVAIPGHEKPQRLLLNLSRNDRPTFERALREELAMALETPE